jgi:hypothetical protein
VPTTVLLQPDQGVIAVLRTDIALATASPLDSRILCAAQTLSPGSHPLR